MASSNEINDAVSTLSQAGCKDLTLLHCVSDQVIKEGGIESFGDYIAGAKTKAFSWYELIQKYEVFFGQFRLNVFLFEDFVESNEAVVNVFFRIFDERLSITFEKKMVENPSVSPKGLEMLRRCNPLLEKDEQSKFRCYIQTVFPKSLNEPFSLFDKTQRADLLNDYKDSNLKLFNKFFPERDASLYTHP